MKKILLTGGTGFIGRNILPVLQQEYHVEAPTRSEWDVYDRQSTDAYLAKNKADILVHCAIATPANPLDDGKSVLESVLRSFLNLKRYAGDFEKVIYIGSGAEYDKCFDIIRADEDDIGKRIPSDEYGLAKYTLTEMAKSSKNIFNLRIFGCYGPFEPQRRFIRHAVECCLASRPVTVRQDCRFSYVFADDLAYAVMQLANKTPARHDYNICGDEPFYLSELAEMIRERMRAEQPVEILIPGLNKEYTGSSNRFKSEFPDFRFTAVQDGIDREISWIKGCEL